MANNSGVEMAQRVQVELVDDFNGEVAQETVHFGVDGTEYEIDLTTENADRLRSTLSEYVDKGRKAKGGRRGQSGHKSSSPSSSTSRSKQDTQQIRQWAQDNGYNPNSRGRVTQSIIDAYNGAH
ncbi:histone-like nucleoid-structuring protein Lsr2 [Arthrobacter sp. MDT1-65]